MSEWLTTGEMIDRLKVGEVAESENGKIQVYFEGYYKILKRKYIDTGDTSYFQVWDNNVRKLKWRILPRYVSFEEAMKALMNGKTVWLWENNVKKVGYRIYEKSGRLLANLGDVDDCITPVNEILFGEKWTIEE